MLNRLFGAFGSTRSDYNPTAEDPDLDAKGAAARRAALEATVARADRDLERKLGELRRQIKEAEEATTKAKAAAHERVEARRAELGREAVEAFYSAADPLVRRWMKEGARDAALELREAFVQFAERTMHELGLPPQQVGAHVVTFAVADVILEEKPALVNALTGANVNPDAVYSWERFVASPIEWISMLERLEARLYRLASAETRLPGDYTRDLYKATRDAPSSRDAMIAGDKVAAEAARKRQAEFVANYKTPSNASIVS